MKKFDAEVKEALRLTNSQEYLDSVQREIERQLQRQAMLAEVTK